MKHPSPDRITRAMSEAQQILSGLSIEGDEQLLADTLEGETDIMRLMDRIAEIAIADKLLGELARGRAQRLEKRADAARDMLRRMMEELGLSKLERGTYTASVALGTPKPVAVDLSELPAEYVRHSPDTTAIGKALRAGQDVPGYVLGNPEPVLRLLTR